MTKTISLELSKKLAPYLKNIEIEYLFNIYIDWDWNEKAINLYSNNMLDIYKDPMYYKNIKTLTLEEAIEFLPLKIETDLWPAWIKYFSEIRNTDEWRIYKCVLSEWGWNNEIDHRTWKTPLEAIEKMLTYILDNNLLPND